VKLKKQPNLSERTEWILSIMLYGSGAALMAAGVVFYRAHVVRVADPKPLEVSTSEVIGRLPDLFGNPKARWTLVEFGDYQCAPCRRASIEVRRVMSSVGDRLRFQFRNYPLRPIHPLSQSAAVAAEVARSRGEFWKVHDWFYDDVLTTDRIQSVNRTYASVKAMAGSANERDASAVVEKDIKAGESLGVNSTPTFFLCCPGNRVYRLGSLKQVQQLVRDTDRSFG